ncbi:MAG: hypothetical protein JNL52_13515 [Flavobacteriales bacterium]|nr:hypothetical protein [Flavobacteriales bacterium]
MGKIERFLWIIVAISVVLKLLRLPFSSLLLILGLSLLAQLNFLLFWWLFVTPERKEQIIPMSILSGLSFSIACIGILFKLQLWPMSGIFLSLALPALSATIITALILRNSRSSLSRYTRGILFRAVPLLDVVTVLLALPSGALSAFYHRNDPELAPYFIKLDISNDPAERERISNEIDSVMRARHERDQ